ncbi:MAG: transposase zinc-binding domain-containing protein [Lachnospiraceae bacterium]
MYELHPRPTVIENVNKMIHCGNSSHSGAMFDCPHCGKLKFVSFRCKRRLTVCGNMSSPLFSFCPFVGTYYPYFKAFVCLKKHINC